MAESKSTKKAAAEVVEDDQTVTDEGAGTQPGEQIASTPAEGVAVPDVPGGAVPEATPDELPQVPGQPEPSVDQPDAAVEQLRLDPSTTGWRAGRQDVLPIFEADEGDSTDADSTDS